MVSDVRNVFPQEEKLVRPLLVCSATLCEAERSFNAL